MFTVVCKGHNVHLGLYLYTVRMRMQEENTAIHICVLGPEV